MIIAISIGNEGIYAKQYAPADVEKTRLRLRKELSVGLPDHFRAFFLYLKPEYFDFFNKMDRFFPISIPRLKHGLIHRMPKNALPLS